MGAWNRLTAMAVAKMTKPGRYGDGLGLWLQVSRTGTKAWIFRYERHGRARHMGLGPVHTVTLAEARQKATECRKLLLDGIDPIDARSASRASVRAESAKAITFEVAAEKYIAAHKAGWRNSKHGEQWRATLRTYAFPVFGSQPVQSIDLPLVMDALEPIWTAKSETASRVRGRIEAVLDWATARGYRQGDNPARWKGHLDKLLPARSKVAKVEHHPALPYSELPAFMADLRGREGVSARALEFTILTAVRTGETIGARWSEIEMAARLWTIPGERTKAAKDHRVPLSERALEILAALPREAGSEFLFVGARKGRPLSNMAMLELVRGMVGGGLTVHGFRSAFRDWAAETTGYPSEVVEMALAHSVKDKVEAAYRRGDLFEKRRRLMADWADYCASPAERTGNVVAMRGAAND